MSSLPWGERKGISPLRTKRGKLKESGKSPSNPKPSPEEKNGKGRCLHAETPSREKGRMPGGSIASGTRDLSIPEERGGGKRECVSGSFLRRRDAEGWYHRRKSSKDEGGDLGEKRGLQRESLGFLLEEATSRFWLS